MILTFSRNIKDVLNKELPRDQRLWWVRGVVLEVEEIVRPMPDEKSNPGGRLHDLVLKIGDVDNPEDGYDVQVEGAHHQIEPYDLVSLLGHEEKNAARVTYPRLLINHSTGHFVRVYPLAKRLTWGVLPMVERKFWLSAKTPSSPAAKLTNLVGLIALTGCLFLPLLILSLPYIIGGWLLVRSLSGIVEQPRFSFEKDAPRLIVENYRLFVNFNYRDLTPLYEKLGALFHAEAVNNPAPEIGFVPVPRGLHTVGLLPLSEKERAKLEAPPTQYEEWMQKKRG